MRKFATRIGAALLLTLVALGWLGPAAGESPSLPAECKEFAFSVEQHFITQGPSPPDGNPIISDGDLLGPNCIVCARNSYLLQGFDVRVDLGLDAVDVIDVERSLVAFSTELDSPNPGQFTAGDLLATNGVRIPNIALTYAFGVGYDIGLDALHFIGDMRMIVAFLDEASRWSRERWLANPDALVGMLRQYEMDIWFSTEENGPLPAQLTFLDGDLLSARGDGVIVAANSALLPASAPAGIPARGVDFGLDAVTAGRTAKRELIQFSTEILHDGRPAFTDGDLLRYGDSVVRAIYFQLILKRYAPR